MKRVSAALALPAVVLFGLAFAHPFGNPRVEPAKGRDTLLRGAKIPASAKNVLIAKCADCHSNETRWPVYVRVAPASWLIERDIVEARNKMNLSNWEQLPGDKQEVLMEEIVREAKHGEMPPPQYRALHWDAQLNAADVAALSSITAVNTVESGLSGSGDAARGAILFQKRCTGCHALEGNREGPELAGVFGRRAGSVASFDYSAGLKSSGITWNETTLEKWLSDPDSVAADTKMDFSVPKAQERSDLIAYFQRLDASGKYPGNLVPARVRN